MSIASWTSPPASAFTFPISRVIRSESSDLERSRICANRNRMLPRSGAGTRRQSSHAARAVATARSTSSALERGKVSITSPVDGFRDSKVAVAMCPIVARRHRPEPGSCGNQVRRCALRRVDLGERPGRTCATAVARLTTLAERSVFLAVAAVGAVATIEDHLDIRVVAVVLDHLLEELG